MYNKIKEFREYIQNADDEHVERVISFLNVSGFVEGNEEFYYQSDDSVLAQDAIDFAESTFKSVISYLYVKKDLRSGDERW